ncbi:MAG: glycine rich domain-containing protein [Bacilli bacterium]|nr:glycine rich domain-containing protein [Bacilli bacterium]
MRKKFNKKILIIFLVLLISIGFAYLSTTLNLNGTVGFNSNTFDVHFDNIELVSEDVEYTTLEVDTQDNTKVNASINFKEPSEIFEYTVDVVNGGGIDAKYDSIASNLTSANEDYITIDVKYYDGTTITQNDILRMGQSVKIRVKVIYNYDIDELPSISSTNITTTVSYKNVNVRDITYNRKVWNYDYTGYEQIFVAPKTATYKIELWGAGGGPRTGYKEGYGAYTSGKISLVKGEQLYLYVGGSTTDLTGGYNGGGNSGGPMSDGYYSGSGGATDIRTIRGVFNDFDSLKSRLMVAGAGTGTGWYVGCGIDGGDAGGLIGYSGTYCSYNQAYIHTVATGGTQTHGGYGINGATTGNYTGKFGYAYSVSPKMYSIAGGSGYFAGGTSRSTNGNVSSGAGGSSYISGHIGCVAIEGTSTVDNITFPTKHEVLCDDGTIDIDCSIHNSGKYFTETVMIDGAGKEWKYHDGDTEVTASTSVVGMPTHDGTGTMTGNSGNGYARITLIN